MSIQHNINNPINTNLQQISAFGGTLDGMGGQARGEAYDEGATVGFLGVRAQQVGTKHIFRKQRWTAVADKNTWLCLGHTIHVK